MALVDGVASALLAGLVAPTGESFAGWREDMKSFRIGLIAEPGGGQSGDRPAVLKQAYARALGIPVEIFVARDYAALIDAQATATCRLRHLFDDGLCDGGAALRVRRAGRRAGRRGWRDRHQGNPGHARRPALESLRHRARIGSPSRALDSIAGFALPRLELAAGQVALTGSEPFLVHAESASAAEAMLVDGSVDAIFGWLPANADAELPGGTLQRLEAAGMDKASLSVVWRSSLLRYGPHALRSGLDAELRTTLVAFLTGLKAIAARYLRSPRGASWRRLRGSSRRRLCDGDRDGARAHRDAGASARNRVETQRERSAVSNRCRSPACSCAAADSSVSFIEMWSKAAVRPSGCLSAAAQVMTGL